MSDGSWIGVVALALTSLFAWLNRRDTLRRDDDLLGLKWQNKEQAGQIQALTAAQEECKEESRQCQEDRTADRKALAAATRTLAARDERDKHELQRQLDVQAKQIEALKGQVNK